MVNIDKQEYLDFITWKIKKSKKYSDAEIDELDEYEKLFIWKAMKTLGDNTDAPDSKTEKPKEHINPSNIFADTNKQFDL